MIDHRPLSSLGATDLEWLKACHHFCFAGYQRADRLHWGRLRVINHNVLAVGATTRPSSHTATEILIFAENEVDIVCSDARRLRVAAGEVASVYTGNGIEFSIANPGGAPTHFTTLWLTCDNSEDRAVVRGAIAFCDAESFLASGFRNERAAFALQTPARVRRIAVARGAQVECALATNDAYLLVLDGQIGVCRHIMSRHDGAAIRDESCVTLTSADHASVLLVEA